MTNGGILQQSSSQENAEPLFTRNAMLYIPCSSNSDQHTYLCWHRKNTRSARMTGQGEGR
ncbi:MAG: hypothetical protein CSA34_05570 [Desulfobulbus propionicus]|nr:MAG: hypothetical protein CSA34_05570 [Desulfobulbus propionicus]